jgi:ribonuclease VapC
MVVDTSALLAILFDEPEAEVFARAIARAEVARVSAANLLEAGIVADCQTDARTGRQLDALIADLRVRIEPVTEEQVGIARQAYLDFGRGNHPAKLNFGDCFAYALAKVSSEPLLFKGDDFGQTDIDVHRFPRHA